MSDRVLGYCVRFRDKIGYGKGCYRPFDIKLDQEAIMAKELIQLAQDRWIEAMSGALAGLNPSTQRRYLQRIRTFADWLEGRPITKHELGEFKHYLAGRMCTPSTINGYMSAIRKLIDEAEDLELIDEKTALRLMKVKGERMSGQRLGNWLSLDESQALIDAADTDTLKGKRDRAILGLMVWAGLRRSEVTGLTIGQLQMREGHNVLVDILGKRGRVRSVKISVPLRRAIDEWLDASGRKELDPEALVFVAMRKANRLDDSRFMSHQAIYKLVIEYGAKIGHPELRPHDLRRTFAQLARKGGGKLEAIQQDLGHESIKTTQDYLGSTVSLDNASSDAIKLRM